MNGEDRARFNFYALAGTADAPDGYQVPVTAELQDELSLEFARQLAAFDVDGSKTLRYDPQYRPDEGEIFAVDGFPLPPPLSDPGRIPQLPDLSDAQIEEGAVRALVGLRQPQGRQKALLCFQAVDGRQMLKRTRFSIVLSQDVFTRNDRSGLVVREALTAVFRDGVLYFQSESDVRRFVDLSPLFTEATDPQVEAFFRKPAFAVEDPAALVRLADRWTRRKISSIEARGILREVDPGRILAAARKYGVAVQVKKAGKRTQLVLPPTKKELKDFLRLLDQDYLDSRLTPDRFQVSSKRRL